MARIQVANEQSGSGHNLPGDTRVLFELEAWMPSEIEAISPLLDRLTRLIKESHCVCGEEACVELAIAEP